MTSMNVIFLSDVYRDLIKNSNWDMSILHPNLIKNHLARNDIRAIEELTNILCQVGRPLARLGFEKEHDREYGSNTIKLEGNSQDTILEERYSDLMSLPLGAYCLDENNIVLWVDDDSDQNCHITKTPHADIVKNNQLVILESMSRVMRKMDILNHPLFEKAVIHRAVN